MATNRPRFSLFAILEWTAAIAFFCALTAGAGGRSVWTSEFTTLPPDDSKLLAWLESNNHRDVVVSRKGNSLTLTSHTGLVRSISNAFSLPKPPWEKLGYGSVIRMHGSMRWTMFNGSPYLWLAGFAVLTILGMIRRRFIKPINEAKEADKSIEPQ